MIDARHISAHISTESDFFFIIFVTIDAKPCRFIHSLRFIWNILKLLRWWRWRWWKISNKTKNLNQTRKQKKQKEQKVKREKWNNIKNATLPLVDIASAIHLTFFVDRSAFRCTIVDSIRSGFTEWFSHWHSCELFAYTKWKKRKMNESNNKAWLFINEKRRLPFRRWCVANTTESSFEWMIGLSFRLHMLRKKL